MRLLATVVATVVSLALAPACATGAASERPTDDGGPPSLAALRARVEAASTDEASLALADVARGLVGRRVAWTAWLVHGDGLGAHDALVLVADDPYAPAARAPLAATVIVSGLAPDVFDALVPGQRVAVKGVIVGATLGSDSTFWVAADGCEPGPDPLAPPAGRPPRPAPDKAFRVKLERTMCLGECPVYEVVARGDGSVEWWGKASVAVVGTRGATLPPGDLARLVRAFERAGFERMPDYMDEHLTDLPTTILGIGDVDAMRTVHHYAGDSSAPLLLEILEAQVDHILGTARWIWP